MTYLRKDDLNIQRQLDSINKIIFKNKMTRPTELGKKILFLATAPCVQSYFDNESIRKQFEDYDLACINYMLEYSQKEMFEWQPKYFILFDPIFYRGSRNPEDADYNSEKEKVCNILERVNWKCYVVTSVLADFELKNENVSYIYISCFEVGYKKYLHGLYKRNLINMGIYNVVQGAIYFAITFGYKDISIIGCTYTNLPIEMTEKGLRVQDHTHYYDLTRYEETISFERLLEYKDGYMVDLYKRAEKSHRCFWNLRRYGERLGATITNYSPKSMIDAFAVGRLSVDNNEVSNNGVKK